MIFWYVCMKIDYCSRKKCALRSYPKKITALIGNSIGICLLTYFSITWNCGTVDRMSIRMEAKRNNELTITKTWVCQWKLLLLQKITGLCCGWRIWILKQFPNEISQLRAAHSLKMVHLAKVDDLKNIFQPQLTYLQNSLNSIVKSTKYLTTESLNLCQFWTQNPQTTPGC